MSENPSPSLALQQLLDGNKRFVAGSSQRPRQSPARRIEVAEIQHPFAVVLSCSDSRVPPEIVFDQGLGDLFVVRNAGHIPDASVLETIAYGIEFLGCRLVMVLGHKNCGAVKAAVEGEIPAYLSHAGEALAPVVKRVRFQPSAMVDNAVRLHTQMTVHLLRGTPAVASREGKAGEVKVVGAYYDLNDGSVSILD